MQLHANTLPKATAEILGKIKNISSLKDFYLSGGSALSLQLGHRESEDLDFFTKISFDPQLLQQKLLRYGELRDIMIDEGTLNVFMDGVKLQFLYYPYNLLEEFIPWNGINLSSINDIACTKLITISMRGSKKDFIDLYVIMRQITLKDLFSKLDIKHAKVQYNYPHILKSLIYFEDADAQPMPRMHVSLDWEKVKDFIIQEVKKIEF
jgi:hypothetical protein